jgi:hypothetical protein
MSERAQRFGYVKDYDAIVRLGSNGSEASLCSGIRNTPKAAQYDEELAKSLAQERLVKCVLQLIRVVTCSITSAATLPGRLGGRVLA